jgi:hypothetical protein
LWFGVGVALLGLLPYVLWNAGHDWATLEFIQNAREHKISDLSPLEFLQESMLEANPLTLPLWLGGLAWLLLARRARWCRPVGMMFVLTLGILIFQKSKPYYLAASFPVLMAAGGAAWESWTARSGLRWVRWLLAANLVAGGVVFAPLALPVLPLEDSVAYMQKLGIVPNTAEVGHTSPAPQYFSDRFGWEELARTVSEVYTALPAADQAGCVVLVRNYGQAGALEYWAQKYTLPPVACGHNNYWLWGPPTRIGNVVIAVNFSRPSLEQNCRQVSLAGESVTPQALEAHHWVWVCRGRSFPLAEVWAELKSFI